MNVVIPSLLDSLEGDSAGHLVRVISLSGFGLRDASDGAVVVDGEIRGSILGGLADAAIVSAASANAGRQRIRTSVTDASADAAGMVCGGSAHLLLTPLSDLDPLLIDVLQTASAFALATVVGPDSAGVGQSDLVIDRKREAGSLGLDPSAGEAGTDAVLSAARDLLGSGATASEIIELDTGVEILITAVVPQTQALIVGSGPMADAIAAQGSLMGWTSTTSEDVDAGLAFLATAGPADALIVLSHEREVDVPLLDAALGSAIGYIGGMGSRGTQSARAGLLAERGRTAEEQARIHGPIGLDLGSRTPAETAVAIAAEFLANRSGRSASSLGSSTGPING